MWSQQQESELNKHFRLEAPAHNPYGERSIAVGKTNIPTFLAAAKQGIKPDENTILYVLQDGHPALLNLIPDWLKANTISELDDKVLLLALKSYDHIASAVLTQKIRFTEKNIPTLLQICPPKYKQELTERIRIFQEEKAAMELKQKKQRMLETTFNVSPHLATLIMNRKIQEFIRTTWDQYKWNSAKRAELYCGVAIKIREEGNSDFFNIIALYDAAADDPQHKDFACQEILEILKTVAHNGIGLSLNLLHHCDKNRCDAAYIGFAKYLDDIKDAQAYDVYSAIPETSRFFIEANRRLFEMICDTVTNLELEGELSPDTRREYLSLQVRYALNTGDQQLVDALFSQFIGCGMGNQTVRNVKPDADTLISLADIILTQKRIISALQQELTQLTADAGHRDTKECHHTNAYWSRT